ncbi:Gfo/Idh/MocA family protein [Nostocoides australiense]|uniref:Inositol 2-dehydrogenase n=1 Tax=Nostocoides australiense Ben110 TaxID=1193182 RepID=W6JZN2_9MICO|nr:Gfo/Idh/MocA family oxidoreductase [Tetrasphaera australiensis]CCH74677.1 Inositol 2-dehydrogenase [Tetrasphaera australiensis Ben110]HPF80380.1 Gfo/Idh/MocA family oxidoreductase [Tetrasphaera australiensis]HRW00873.1 Gfo/Idh/MocA family oxidoreductase [Tetrasphaera sp.]
MAENELRVGVIGVGMMGADHADRLVHRVAGARLVAVSDPDTARAAALAGRYDGVRSVDDPLALVADDEVDAVVIASPGFVHEEQVLACIAAGKYVLCEKPLTMDSESSLRVLRAEREAGKELIQVGFMRRFDPQYAQLQQLLASGDLGRTLLLHNTHRNKSVPNPEFRSEMIVRDSLVHEVDVARFMFGQEITTIQVLSPAPTSHACEGVVDPQVALFTMAGGGVVSNEVFVNCQVGYEVRCEAVSERGTAIAGRPQSGLYTTRVGEPAGSWGGTVDPDFIARFGLAYDLEFQAWVDATRRGEVVGATSWDGYASTAVCEAGMQSLASGQPVAVTLVDKETLT